MHTPTLPRSWSWLLRAGVLLAAAVPLAIAASCATDEAAARGAQATSPASATSAAGGTGAPAGIVIDGDIAEWPRDVWALATDQHLFARFTFAGELFTLQSAGQTTALALDIDDDASTGEAVTARGQRLGVDLWVEFSPRDARSGAPRSGVRVSRVGADGAREALPHAAADVMFAPTYAARWYELRLARRFECCRDVMPARGLLTQGPARGTVVYLGEDGSVEGAAEPFALSCPPLAPAPALADEDLPTKPTGAVRVVSFNVLRSGPLERPEQFRRLLEALEPDVVLLQEWDQGSASDVAAWFNALVPSTTPWRAEKRGWSALVARHPMRAVGPERVTVGPEHDLRARQGDRGDRGPDVRVLAAMVDTPAGPLLATTLHLKCCGSFESDEDLRRLAEARAINEMLRSALGDTPPALRVVGGDVNLVGSRPPLDVLRAGLDVDGGDLDVAPARVLGDGAFYTWREDDNAFTPGRLDWIVYSGAAARAANAFVLDTRRLSDAALARAGLDRSDSLASDHLPVVVDLLPAR